MPASLPTDTPALIAALLAALGPNQDDRLLRLHTPLGTDVLLAERLHGLENLGPALPFDGTAPAGFKLEVLALSTNAHLELKRLIGQPVRLDLLTAASRTALRPFHGHVTGFALLGSDGGLARYKLTIEPWLAFLGHRHDAWVFQDKTVIDIVDEVFADYQAQGKLAPAWRWALADASVYARRSLCIQYHESDLAFVQRLLAEEGLVGWFEHEADAGPTLGRHTLVIADHNAALRLSEPQVLPFTQSGSASFTDDGLRRFAEARQVVSSALASASWDYRSVQSTASDQAGDEHLAPGGLALSVIDQPGAYAYEDRAQAERLAARQLEALQAPAHRFDGVGSVRTLGCGQIFALSGHPSVSADQRLAVLRVEHRARNNLSADLSTGLHRLLRAVPAGFVTQPSRAGAAKAAGTSTTVPADARHTRADRRKMLNASDEPLYVMRLRAQDARVPVRASGRLQAQGDLLGTSGGTSSMAEKGHAPSSSAGPRGMRPQIHGVQTAIVVGEGAPVHSDRDGRVKLQFHWQRGVSSSLRLDHAAGSNAPGDASAGTWVRVGRAWAGANWGSHFTPRVGQEVLVAFIEGDIDRPVVVGSVYNGRGQPDAQGNAVACGPSGASGNAPAWFTGQTEGHAHAHVLTGFKSQSLATSSDGMGAHNALVLDDSPGQSRLALGTTQASTWLQLGHLLQQSDNQRLASRGHGLELGTQAQGALRAGSGLHLQAEAQARGTASAAQPMQAREALSQIEQAAQLTASLAATAQKHRVQLPGEPQASSTALGLANGHASGRIAATSGGAASGSSTRAGTANASGKQAKPEGLPVQQGLSALAASLSAVDTGGASGSGAGARGAGPSPSSSTPSIGGTGTVAAPSRPDLLVHAPGGIAWATPADALLTAGTTLAVVAGQDANLVATGPLAVAVKSGLSLFTYGKASDASRPVAQTGLQLHAASGSVSVQAQSDRLEVVAERDVDVASPTATLTASAPKHLLFAAAGSALRVDSSGITLTTTGSAHFKASLKELAGPAGASADALTLAQSNALFDEQFVLVEEGSAAPMSHYRYRIEDAQGRLLDSGITDEHGRTKRVHTAKGVAIRIVSDGTAS